MQLPPQHDCEAPPHVVGVTHTLALHTSPPAHGSAPAQHAAFMPPQPAPASVPADPWQVPLVQV